LSDSLYKLSLNGSEGKFGFIKIADEYSGTDAANLANYYAGMALNTAKYTEAIEYLSKFKSEDVVLA
jgi:cytochrome c553